MTDFLDNLLHLALESAPWLVLGLVLGGIFKVFLPTDFLNRHLQQNRMGSLAKATLLGAPLPLCSCGVVPAAVGLRQAGASKSATVSFLIATPETGPDSISLTYALLGPFIALYRTLSALFSAFFSGLLVMWFDPSATQAHPAKDNTACCPTTTCGCDSNDTRSNPAPAQASSCCDANAASASTSSCCAATEPSSETGCCETPSPSQTLRQRLTYGMRYAFKDMWGDIMLWLALGLVFAALVQTYLPSDFLAQWGSGWLAMLVMLLIGIPMYVCATASTPIAVGLILAGVSPGVALVFLLSGPATNIGTLGIIAKLLGKRALLLYLLGTVSSALFAGWLLDWLIQANAMTLTLSSGDHASFVPIELAWVCLLFLLLISFTRRLSFRVQR